jgi:ATP-binding cassette subfamily F protein 3
VAPGVPGAPTATAAAVAATPPRTVVASKPEAGPAHGTQRHKRPEGGAQRKPIEREIAKLEQEIERLTAEKGLLDARLGDAGIYLPSRQAELSIALQRSAEVTAKLEAAETDWMSRQEALGQLQQTSS